MTSPRPQPGRAGNRPTVAIVAVGVAVVIALIVVANIIFLSTGDDDDSEASSGPSATESTPAEPTADPTGPPAKVELRPVIRILGKSADCHQPGVWCTEDERVGGYRLGPAELRTRDIVSAQARLSEYGAFVVGITLSDDGAAKFEQLTTELAQKSGARSQLAIVIDDVVISAPQVQGTIPGGEIDISGDFTQDEAERLAVAIDP